MSRPVSGGPAARFSAAAAVAIAVAGCVFTLHASYPGYPNPDSIAQGEQALSGAYDDWQSPFPKILWSLLLKLMLDPGVFIVFYNLLIWGSLLALALALRQRLGPWSALVTAIPLLPGAYNFLGNPTVDTLLVGWLLAAVTAAHGARRAGLSARARLAWRLLANLFILAAFLTRINAIFALVPLLLYVNAPLGWRRNLATCLALVVAMPLLYKAQNLAFDVQPRHAGDSIKVFHLLALSYHERKNLLPGNWTVEQSHDVANACYSPIQWDTAWWGQCSFIHDELQRQGLWGSPELTRTWLKEILRRPLVQFSLLAATFKRSLFEPNSRAMLYKTPNRWNWEVADNPPRESTELARGYIRSEINDGISRPWLFAVISALAILLVFRLPPGAAEEGRLALAILASGLVYLLTYFCFNVSAEFRYFYWTLFATYIGVVVLALAWRSGRGEASGAATSGAVRISALALAALAIALVLAPSRLPQDRRVVTVTPLDSRPVVVQGVASAGLPKWIANRFEGEVAAAAWISDGQGYRAVSPSAPFTVRLDALKEVTAVSLATGPGFGTVEVSADGFQQVVTTDAPFPGKRVVPIPPLPITGAERWGLPLLNAGGALLLFGAVFVAALRLIAGQSAPAAAGSRWRESRLLRFSLVGGVGFAIEAIVLTYLAAVPAVGAMKGRLVSFPLAVLATWWLNRRLTFRSTNEPRRESFRYFLVQSLGALANLIVFTLLVALSPFLAEIPVVPLFFAALVGLLINFSLSKKFVFVPS